MAPLPEPSDPTLEAADRALEARENVQKPRPYLGMSAIGAECERNLWYGFHWATAARHSAETLKRFADGHHGEDVQAERLRLVDGITLLTVDEQTGEQFGFDDCGGHFSGHMDGAILGLIQAPKTWHVWEHKQVGEKKQSELVKLKAQFGEKAALEKWNPVYYAQAVLYMHYSGMDRHYLTCSTPGGRSTISVRTEPDEAAAIRLKVKAERIIASPQPPERISADPAWFQCRWCDHAAQCHTGKLPEFNCRTCACSTPVDGGAWRCERDGRTLSYPDQVAACPAHLFIPGFIHGEQTDADPDGLWIEYQMKNGETWIDTAVPF